MSKVLIAIVLLAVLALPATALSITAPEVPKEQEKLMPQHTESFREGLIELLNDVLPLLRPDLAEAANAAVALIAAAMTASILKSASDAVKYTVKLACSACICSVLFLSANSLIRLGTDTIEKISEYGKLLLPVMASAMAAQGSFTGSAALYTGTAVFDAVLCSIFSGILIPAIYLYLALAAADSVTTDHSLKKIKDLFKNGVAWFLKTSLTIYISYMGITGVISGTADAAALKTTRSALSTAVPVVGGILANASEAVLVSAGLVKNAAGIYGIFAILAILLAPFLRIGVHYLILKLSEAVCAILDEKEVSELIGDFSGAMGLILGMTGAVCFLQLMSTVCFLKGAG